MTSYLALKVPLGPGVLEVSTNLLSQGENTVDIIGYNTHFDDEDLQAWLAYDSYSICPSEINVADRDHMALRFDIPSTLPSKALRLMIYTEQQGLISYSKNYYVDSADVDSSVINSPCYAYPLKTLDAPLFAFPNRERLRETVRNLNFHVPMWFAMIFLMLISFISSIVYLRTENKAYDDVSYAAISTGLIFAISGLVTGAIWAKFTWGDWWTRDPQLNGALVSTLIYFAYFLLRSSIADEDKRARLVAVYSIFAFVMFYVLIKVIPGMADYSLHPDTTDNPSFKDYDVGDRLKFIFRMSAAAWIALSFWIFTLRYRLLSITRKRIER